MAENKNIKRNQTKENQKISYKKYILIGILAVIIAFVGTCTWYIAKLFDDIIEPPDSSIFDATPSESLTYSTATPRPDMKIEYVDGSAFTEWVFSTDEYSTSPEDATTSEFAYIKSITTNPFCITSITIGESEETSYIFEKAVRVYLPVPVGFDYNNIKLYSIDGTSLHQQQFTTNGTFVIIETNNITPYVFTHEDLISQLPTPTPGTSSTPVVTPTITPTPSLLPTVTPIVTPTPEITPIPTTTPVPTPSPTPSPTPIVTPAPTPSPIATPTPVVTPSAVPTTKPTPVEGVINIALFGIDGTGSNFTGRSDTIMILSLDTINHKMTLTSVMRDLYVRIYNEHDQPLGMGKINAAFWQKPAGAMYTLEHYFDIEIDNYAVINFGGMKSVIDILGGVDLLISAAEAKIVFGVDVTGPYQCHMDGEQALAYMRIRKIDSDRVRNLRQGIVLQALLDKFKNTSLDRLLELLNECSKYVKTGISVPDMITIATEVYKARDGGFSHSSYPLKYKKYDGDLSQWFATENNKEYNMNWFHDRIYNYVGE